jgi:hypothetical protein
MNVEGSFSGSEVSWFWRTWAAVQGVKFDKKTQFTVVTQAMTQLRVTVEEKTS